SRSLDAAVAKLNDIQRTKSEPLSPSPAPPPTATLTTVSTTPSTPRLTAPPTTPQVPLWASSMHLDPQAYLSLISRLVQSSIPTTTAPPLPPTVPPAAVAPLPTVTPSSPSPHDELFDQRVSTEGEEEEEERDEKTYDDSSPSPSEQSTMRDDDGDDDDKPFVCPHVNCLKRFGNKFLLKKHQFIHTGLRPHACPYCTKRFNRKDNLLRHKKTHLGGEEATTPSVNISMLLSAAAQEGDEEE
ncbi:hypothetical protein PFISCL1PPCAC_28972, partial [Pristionchus fissidentatus]